MCSQAHMCTYMWRSYARQICESQTWSLVSSIVLRFILLGSLAGQPACGICFPLPLVLVPSLGFQTHTLVFRFLHECWGPELLFLWPALPTKPFPPPLLLLYVYCQQPRLFQGTPSHHSSFWRGTWALGLGCPGASGSITLDLQRCNNSFRYWNKPE